MFNRYITRNNVCFALMSWMQKHLFMNCKNNLFENADTYTGENEKVSETIIYLDSDKL